MEICLTKLHAVFQIALFYLCVLAWMRLDLFGGCQSPDQKNCNWSCFPFCSKTMRFFSSCTINMAKYRGLPPDPSNWAENFTLWPNWMSEGSRSVVQTKFLKLYYFYCISNQYPKNKKNPAASVCALVLNSHPGPAPPMVTPGTGQSLRINSSTKRRILLLC